MRISERLSLASEGDRTKSSKLGPALSLSENVVSAR